MDLGLKDKKCLVTGGCNGIGAAITKNLLDEGCKVVATTRTKFSGEKFKDSLEDSRKQNFSYQIAELSNIESINTFINKIIFEFDILVNNAGHDLKVKNPRCSIEEWNQLLTLNFLSSISIVNSVTPYMKQKRWGRIVNITSCAGLENSGAVPYTCAKAALTAYTRSMGRVLAMESPGLVMTAVYPGVIKTPGGHWERILEDNPDHAKNYLKTRCPLGRFGEIDEFVPAVIFFCSERASFAHGSIVGIDGGQSKHFLNNNYEP